MFVAIIADRLGASSSASHTSALFEPDCAISFLGGGRLTIWPKVKPLLFSLTYKVRTVMTPLVPSRQRADRLR